MNTSDELRRIVESVTPRLERLAGAEVTDRPAPGKWSKTEIRGLHEGNAIRYRLRPDDLAGFSGS